MNPLNPLNWIGWLAATLWQIWLEFYVNTFAKMDGPQILWTVIALIAVLQLVFIKIRLRRINHQIGAEAARSRFRRFVSGGRHMNRVRADRPAFQNFGFGRNFTERPGDLGFTANNSGREDMSNKENRGWADV